MFVYTMKQSVQSKKQSPFYIVFLESAFHQIKNHFVPVY